MVSRFVGPGGPRGVHRARALGLGAATLTFVTTMACGFADGDPIVTGDTLAEFQARIDAASDGVHMARTTVTARRAATERLRVLLREMDAMLREELDPLVEQLAENQPQFHADYRAAREVVDVPGSRPPAESTEGAGEAESPPVAPTATVADSASIDKAA